MSQRKQPRQPRPEAGESSKKDSSSGTVPLTRSRRWAYRLLAIVLVPGLVLGFGELGLRLAGWGHPASFFVNTRIKDQDVYIANDYFGLRFFPAALARSPTPLVMSARKNPEVCRIFVLGESAALGDPEPAYGVGRWLQVLLQERFPGRRFEVVCTAMTAINSHVILPIARECAGHEGDVWVLYMGNNEFVGPFGAGTVFGPQSPPLGLIRLSIALKATRLGQLIARLGSLGDRQESWGGMKMFLDQQVAPADPRKAKVYAHFQRNLEEILRGARSAGVKVVVSTVASNLKDCAPFASIHKAGVSNMAEWDRLYEQGADAEKAGDFGAAMSRFTAAAELDESYADLQYHLGRCYLGITNNLAARRHFERARDCDGLAFRADSRLNQIIRDAVAQTSGQDIQLSDNAAELGATSSAGITGSELFLDHVHLNFEGNYVLARSIAEQLAKLLPVGAAREDKVQWASMEQCSRRLAITKWDQRRVYEEMAHRISGPPFISQMNHQDSLDGLQRALKEIRPLLTPEAAEKARVVYGEAIGAASDDFFLHAGLAKLDEDTGNLDGAIAEWQRVRDLIPFAPGPYYYAGKLLAREGKFEPALESLSQALKIRPDLAEALSEKGQVLVKQNQAEEGLALLVKASKLQPGNPRLLVEQAQALMALNRRGEALAQLRESVRLQPAYWEAHYFLGVELAMDGKIHDAAEQFLQVVRLNPGYALGHLNLGIALAKLGRKSDALAQFRETVRLDPNNKKANEYLAALEQAKK